MRSTRWTCRLGLIAMVLGCGCGTQQEPDAGPATQAGGQTLEQRLDALKLRLLSSAPAERIEAFERGIEQVRASGIAGKALAVGDQAPDFSLPNATGKAVRLAELLKRGPVVVAWYRGVWCPYCNTELQALQESLHDIRDLGATLVAVSPQTPDHSLSTAQKGRLQFEVLSDADNKVARRFGIVYKVADEVIRLMKPEVDLGVYNANNSNELPLPATFVIDTRGVIRFAFVDPDYRKRAEPADVLLALQKLRAR